MYYIYFGAGAFLSWSAFTFGHPEGTLGGRIVLALDYAFAPLIIGLFIARLIPESFSGLRPGQGSTFRSNLEMSWGLALVIATFVCSMTVS